MAYADEERDKVALVEFSIAVQREINVRCHHFKPADGDRRESEWWAEGPVSIPRLNSVRLTCGLAVLGM